MLQIDDKWVWDFWFAKDGDEHHMFYLQAPRALLDEQRRHRNATIGHAVSKDLSTWTLLPDALAPGLPGTWDDIATWTGCVVRADDRWLMFYTGISTVEDGLVQRIGVAFSDDLISWEKYAGNPIMEADPRWYELLGEAEWHNQAWRDPWVYQDGDGHYHALITARSNTGPTSTRGVVGHAVSEDMLNWDVREPIAEPRVSGDLEVPQLYRAGDREVILFCTYRWDEVAAPGMRGPTIAYLSRGVGDQEYGFSPENVLVPGSEGWYAGRAVSDSRGVPHLLMWRRLDGNGDFVGHISDPVPLQIGSESLSVGRPSDESRTPAS